MFEELEAINARPEPFEFYTARELWTDEHTSRQMLSFHLNEETDVASRKGEFIRRSVEWIASYFNVGAGTKIADFGCGPGLYTAKLAQKQADVTGIDFSARAIQHARQVATMEGLSIHYINQDYLKYDTEDRFHIMIMCDFCALSPGQRALLLGKFHSLLAANGKVLLDVYSRAMFEARAESATYAPDLLDGFWSPEPYFGFLSTFKYERECLLLDKYTIVERDRVRRIFNWLQCFTPAVLERELADRGLRVAERWGDVAGGSYVPTATEFAIVAERCTDV